MSVIDYSKWDRFADDQSSSDEEDPRPHVTRLDQPSRIVTNGQGVISVNPPVATAVAKQSSSTSNSPDAIPSAWTEKGGTCNLNDHVLYWSQERHSVTFRIPVAHKFRKWQVDVTNILSFSQRHCSTSSDEMKLRIEAGNSETEYWAGGTLPHPGHLPEEGEVDWCIEPHANKKYFILVLGKAVPMEGLLLWWKRPFVECPETFTRQETAQQKTFKAAWDEAHASFKEQVKSPQKHLL